jgi:hypothetical protein
MLRKILPTIAATAASLSFAMPAFAQAIDPCPKANTTFANLCNITGTNPGALVGRIIIFILVVAAILALFYLIWGGVKWIMSGGDKAKVDTARQTIIAAIIGLIVTFLAFFIISLVLSLFGLGGITTLTLPTIAP